MGVVKWNPEEYLAKSIGFTSSCLHPVFFLLSDIDYISYFVDWSQLFDMRKLIPEDAFSIPLSCWGKGSCIILIKMPLGWLFSIFLILGVHNTLKKNNKNPTAIHLCDEFWALAVKIES